MSEEPSGGGHPGPSGQQAPADVRLGVEAEGGALAPNPSQRRSSRRWFAGMLVVLAVVSFTAWIIAIWTRETVYDTDRFMEVVEPALADPAFYTGLSDYVSDASLEALDLDTRVATSLDVADAYLAEALVAALGPDPRVREQLRAFDRPTLGALSPSISAALEAQVVETVDRFITSEEFRFRFPGLVRQAHAGGVALVTDDLEALPNVYIEDGDVRVDLIPVVIDALQEVTPELRQFLPDVTLPAVIASQVQPGREQLREELGASLQVQLPEDFGQFTVVEQRSLAGVQQFVGYTDRLVWVTALLTLVLLAAAVVVSPNRRRTLIQLALGVVAGLMVAILLVRRLQEVVLGQLTDPDGIQAVQSIFRELALSLRNLTVLVAVVALGVGVLAYLAGRPPWLDELRHRRTRGPAPSVEGRQLDRWVADHLEALRVAGFAIALGTLLLLLGLDLLPLVLVAALLSLYLWAISSAHERIDTHDVEAPTTMDRTDAPPPVDARSSSAGPAADA